MKTTFDTDSILYKILKNAPEVVSAITGGIYKGDRPDDSEKEDITINTIDLTVEDLPQIGTSNVNIHVPDMTVNIGGTSQKKANDERLKQITTIVLDTLRSANIPDLELIVTNQVKIREQSINQHFVNIRINWNIH